MKLCSFRCLSLAASISVMAGASAGISQITITAPGGFAQAACYTITSSSIAPGADLATMGLGQSFEEHSFAGDSTCGASASYSGPPSTTNSASATVTLGGFRGRAFDSTLTTNPFPAGICNGGWKESFTVNNPALTGQAGFMTFKVRTRGALSASGDSGSALIELASYKNEITLQNNPYFDPGNSDIMGTSQQYGRWGIATYSNIPFDSRTVDGTVTFSVPMTFGQSFTLGVYARISAGLRSSGGFGGIISKGDADFSGAGVTWDGIATIRNAAGVVVSGSTVVSGSGLDWSGSFGCPPDFDADGFVTGDDFDAYVLAFEAGNPLADFDKNGFVNGDDFDAYVAAFESGC